jgi:mRNA-degrading endonuclease RelE of RelBE toxin-antitoxin system
MSPTAIFREVARLPEFERDLKGLARRFRTIEEDLAILLRAQIMPFHKLGVDNRGVVRISGLPFLEPKIYKVRKFACRSLKGRGANSDLRLIYAYFEQNDRLELIEIYFKGDKENEDKERIIGLYAEVTR